MIRTRWRLSLVPVLAMALALGACDRGAAPERLLGPDVLAAAKGGAKTEKVKKEKKQKKVKVKKKNGKVVELNLATGYLPDLRDVYAKAEIGAEGGSLSASGHRLVVPAGAVDAPTTFKMRQYKKALADGTVVIAVELRAVRTLADGTELDVGEQGFAVPLELSLTYTWSDNVDDSNAGSTSIVWLKSDTEAEEVDPTVDHDTAGDRVEIDLWHFSDYALIWP